MRTFSRALLSVVALVTAGAVVAACSSGKAPAPDRPTVAAGDLLVVVDGWSYASFDGKLPRLYVDGEPVAVSFRPATVRQLGQVLDAAPESMTALMARLVTADPELSCTVDVGCVAGGEELPLTLLTDPASIPVFGDIYAEHQIGAGAYVATVDTGGSSRVEVSMSTDAASRFSPRLAPSDDGQVMVLGYAFGQLFEPVAAWHDDPVALTLAPQVTTGLSNPTTVADIAAGPFPLLRGPAVNAGPVGDGLSVSQLMVWSSPTTGCFMGIECSPAPGRAKVTSETLGTTVACTTQTNGGDRTPVVVVARSQTWEISSGFPFHQLGVWHGTEPTDPDMPLLMFGDVPLITEPVEVRVHLAELYVDGPALFDVFGVVAEVGVDPVELVEFPWGPAEAVELGGLVPCDDGVVQDPSVAPGEGMVYDDELGEWVREDGTQPDRGISSGFDDPLIPGDQPVIVDADGNISINLPAGPITGPAPEPTEDTTLLTDNWFDE